MSSQQNRITVSRPLTGILALACIALAGAIWVVSAQDESWKMWSGPLLRVGLVMAAFWLALPSRHREAAWSNMSPWTFVGILVAVFAFAAKPKVMIPILVVAVILGYFLRPRSKKRPQRRE